MNLYKVDPFSILFILSKNKIVSSETVKVLSKTKLFIKLEYSLLSILTGTKIPTCYIFIEKFQVFGTNILFKRVFLISNVFFVFPH